MSMYPTTSLIKSEKLQTVDELIETLQLYRDTLSTSTLHLDVGVSWDDTYTKLDDALVQVELVEKILSDGSRMHDIKLNFSENV